MRSLATLALLAGVPLLAVRAAQAMQYEIFVDVRTEQDLYDLRNEEQIGEESFETLRALMSQPVSLNSSRPVRLQLLPNLDSETLDQILTHRSLSSGPISLAGLVEVGILTERVASSLRPFVLAPKRRDTTLGPARGFLRLQTRMTGRYDRYPPATALQARMRTSGGLQVGLAAILLRNRVGQARYQRERNALFAPPPRARLIVPKLFLLWRNTQWNFVVGTYRIGFAQRLVFDSTAEAAPHGFLGDDELRRSWALVRRCAERAIDTALQACPHGGAVRVTPDHDWTNRLTGMAFGLRSPLGRGRWIETHAWGSYQVHGASQYELRLAAQCANPRDDEDEACDPPPVLIARREAKSTERRWTATRLPRMYAEALGGANLSFFWNARSQIGITGYGAKLRWLLRDVKLALQESAQRPFRGSYGAIGLNLAHGKPKQDFQIELARSFDRQSSSGGGWAVLARSLSRFASAQIEISGRYYGSQYANPHARPSSAADELEGLRARDEAGLRLLTRLELGTGWVLRGSADLWRQLSLAVMKSEISLRADFEPSSGANASIWIVQRTTQTQQGLRAAVRMSGQPSQRLRVSGQLQQALARRRPQNNFSKTYGAIATLAATPCERARFTLRLRYDLEQESEERRPGARAFWAYLNTALELARGSSLQLRYDFRRVVDESWSNTRRRPNPEHWLNLEYSWRSP